jgi:hypothetical protein
MVDPKLIQTLGRFLVIFGEVPGYQVTIWRSTHTHKEMIVIGLLGV